MKGIYISHIDLENSSDGVAKKITYQIETLRKNDIDIVPPYTVPKKKSFLLEKLRILDPFFSNRTDLISVSLKKILAEMTFEDMDFVYIRKSYIDNYQIMLYKKLREKKRNLKIIMEIPTFPYDKEVVNLKKYTLLAKDKRARKKLCGLVDRVVTYSDDKVIFGIPTIRISNGIDFSSVTPKKKTNGNEISIIAVALFGYWHGYDRFIEGMKDYYSSDYKKKVILHLVGYGPALQTYKDLTIKYKLEDYIIFHGKLFGEELDEIYNKCDITLDALARHRGGLYYNSSLKGKEYCAKGLPIISGVRTELDDFSGFPYYMRVPADDTVIDMKSVLNFYRKVYEGEESKEDVINSIIEQTKDRFDMANAFMPVINYIKTKESSL